MSSVSNLQNTVLNVNRTELLAGICRDSFEHFVRMFWDQVPGAQELVWNWHLSIYCTELQRIAERVFNKKPKEHDLIANVPPGTSKSTVWSILFPAWVWTRMPTARFICASHTSELVLDLASKSRDVIYSDLYRELFPDIEIKEDQEAKGNFANTAGGSRLSCTVAGKTPIGFHGHFLLVDDPLDPQRAASDAELRTAAKFVTSIISTRKTDKNVSVTCLIMQRIHVRDPTAAMLEVGAKVGASRIRHICLPAELSDIVSPPELAERYVDGLLDINRLNKIVLAEAKATLGDYDYSCQFEQNPRVLGGGMFKEDYFNNRERAAPYDCDRVRYWDRACLVAGTMVVTSLGDRPIEEIVPGELVLTRKGYRRVKWSGCTKIVNELVELSLPNGKKLIGTPDHPIWTENRGWIIMKSICCKDALLTLEDEEWEGKVPKILNQSSLMELFTLEDRENDTIRPGNGTRRKKSTRQTLFTERFGDSTTERSQKGLISTIRMRTGIITQSRILNVLQGGIITKSTVLCRNGTLQTKHSSRERRILKRCGRKLRIRSTNVSSALKNSSRGESTRPRSSVLPYVENGFGCKESQRTALFVESSFGEDLQHIPAQKSVRTSIGKQSAKSVIKYSTKSLKNNLPVLEAVELNGSGGIPVYDLEVEDAHEFFANGVLVHNSTADGGCYTAGVLLAKDKEGRCYVEDCVHGQWESKERDDRIKATALKDRAKYGPLHEPRIYIEHEPGSSGVDAYKATARKLAGFKVYPDRPSGSKDTRAEPWASQCAAGNVWLIDNGESQNAGKARWDIAGYVIEHCLFRPEPGKRVGKYKDRVDACLLPSAMILTSTGPKRIVDVVPDDKVLTRWGFRRVIWSGQTGWVSTLISVRFSNGYVLTATPNHLVWTENRRWIPIDSLSGDDNIIAIVPSVEDQRWTPGKIRENTFASAVVGSLSCSRTDTSEKGFPALSEDIPEDSPTLKPLGLTESTTIEGLENVTFLEKQGASLCIKPSGSSTMAISPRIMTYIIRTETGIITQSRILNVSQKRNMLRDIREEENLQHRENTSQELETRLESGTVPKREESGTDSTLLRLQRNESLVSSSARCAEILFSQSASETKGSFVTVLRRVVKKLVDFLESIFVTKKSVECAKKSLLQKVRTESAVQESVVHNTGGPIRVYDLEIEEVPEFFADGILVHNSTGAFNKLFGVRSLQGLRTYTFGGRNKYQGQRCCIITREELHKVAFDQKALLIYITDPDPVGDVGIPPHSIVKLQDTLVLQLANINPENFQEKWEDRLEPYGRYPEELIISAETGKRLWAFLLKKRDVPPEVIVVCDDDENRALSLSMAFCDVLRLPRNSCLYLASKPEDTITEESKPPNEHLYRMVRNTRGGIAV